MKDKKETVRIYTLSDKSGNVFYVGCTSRSINKRLIAHIEEARKEKKITKKNTRIKELDFEVIATIVEIKEVTIRNGIFNDERTQLEYFWINKYRALGYNLTNVHPIIKDLIHEIPETEYVGQSVINTPKGIRVIKNEVAK